MQGIGYPRDGKSEKPRRMVRKAEISNSKGFPPPLGWRTRRRGHVTMARVGVSQWELEPWRAL